MMHGCEMMVYARSRFQIRFKLYFKHSLHDPILTFDSQHLYDDQLMTTTIITLHTLSLREFNSQIPWRNFSTHQGR